MAFISKEEMESEAARLNIDLSQYPTWAEKQKAVFAAQASEQGSNIPTKKPTDKYTDEQLYLLSGFKDGKVLISQEIQAMKYQVCKFDEVLGTDVDVEEVKASASDLTRENNLSSGTYRIVGQSGRQVVAQSSLPTENIKIEFDSSKDLVPIGEYGGRRGYIWEHPKYIGIKQLLTESGYLKKYEELFNGTNYPENVWYAGTKFILCSIPFVHYIFSEIEEDAQAKLQKKKQAQW